MLYRKTNILKFSVVDLVHGICYAEWEHLQKGNISKIQGVQINAVFQLHIWIKLVPPEMYEKMGCIFKFLQNILAQTTST